MTTEMWIGFGYGLVVAFGINVWWMTRLRRLDRLYKAASEPAPLRAHEECWIKDCHWPPEGASPFCEPHTKGARRRFTLLDQQKRLGER